MGLVAKTAQPLHKKVGRYPEAAQIKGEDCGQQKEKRQEKDDDRTKIKAERDLLGNRRGIFPIVTADFNREIKLRRWRGEMAATLAPGSFEVVPLHQDEQAENDDDRISHR